MSVPLTSPCCQRVTSPHQTSGFSPLNFPYCPVCSCSCSWLHGWNWRKMPMCDYCYYFYYLSFVYVRLDPCIVAFHPLFHDLQVFGRAQSVSGFLWPETPASSWDALQQEIVLKYYISYKRLLFIYKWNFSDKKKKKGGRHCQASSCSSFIYLFN